MKPTNLYIFFVAFLSLGLSACAVTDFDETANFAEYQTYVWGKSEAKVSNPSYDSDLINKKIRSTVENEFSKRGIMKNDLNPDFVVSYQTYTEKKEQVTGGNSYGYRFFPFYSFRYFPFAYGYGYPYHWMRPETRNAYTEGTLIIDIVDRDSDELVWRGSITGNVDDASALKKQIEKGIKAIMKKYPVKPDAPLSVGNESIS